MQSRFKYISKTQWPSVTAHRSGNKCVIQSCAGKWRHEAAPGEQSWAGSPIALIPATGNSGIPERWRQFQDFHLFCMTIIRASGSCLTLTTAAKASRWKRLRADGSGESLQRTLTGSVKGRCVPTLPTPYQVLIYTYTVYKHHNHM